VLESSIDNNVRTTSLTAGIKEHLNPKKDSAIQTHLQENPTHVFDPENVFEFIIFVFFFRYFSLIMATSIAEIFQ